MLYDVDAACAILVRWKIPIAVLVEGGITIVLSGAVVRRRFKFSSLSAHKGGLALDSACSVWCARLVCSASPVRVNGTGAAADTHVCGCATDANMHVK